MKNYDYMKANLSTVEELVKRGLMSFTIVRDLDIYTSFLSLDKFSKEGRYAILSHDFQLSEKRIEQIVANLSK